MICVLFCSISRQSAKYTSHLNPNVVISHTSHQIYEPNKKLAAWVRTQRKDYKDQRIAPEKVDLLESIGFAWKVLVRNTWEEMYAKLKAYRKVVRIYVLRFVLILIHGCYIDYHILLFRKARAL